MGRPPRKVDNSINHLRVYASTDLSRWYLNNLHVSILGKPSAQLAKDLEQNELTRLEAQRARLGPEGLSTLKRKLEQAQLENDKPIPTDLIRKFKIPRIDNISFIDTVNASYIPSSQHRGDRNKVEQYLDLDVSNHPYHLVFSHTKTEFVTVAMYITTKDLPGRLLAYLQVYLDSFFSLPVTRDGKCIEYEQVVKEINEVAVDYSADLGVEDVTEVICIRMRAEKSKYEKVVRLLSELFCHSCFHPDRYVNTFFVGGRADE